MFLSPLFGHADGKDRDEWFREMLELKHDYLAKELALTKEQQQKFFPVYDSMENETRRMFDQTRALEKRVRQKGDKATDAELLKATDAMYNVKTREAQIERKYYTQFRKLLSPRQLFKLKRAERHFQRQMVKEHYKKRPSKPNK